MKQNETTRQSFSRNFCLCHSYISKSRHLKPGLNYTNERKTEIPWEVGKVHFMRMSCTIISLQLNPAILLFVRSYANRNNNTNYCLCCHKSLLYSLHSLSQCTKLETLLSEMKIPIVSLKFIFTFNFCNLYIISHFKDTFKINYFINS